MTGDGRAVASKITAGSVSSMLPIALSLDVCHVLTGSVCVAAHVK